MIQRVPCKSIDAIDDHIINARSCGAAELKQLSQLGAIGRLRGFTAFDKDADDLQRFSLTEVAAGAFLALETQVFGLFFCRDAAINYGAHIRLAVASFCVGRE